MANGNNGFLGAGVLWLTLIFCCMCLVLTTGTVFLGFIAFDLSETAAPTEAPTVTPTEAPPMAKTAYTYHKMNSGDQLNNAVPIVEKVTTDEAAGITNLNDRERVKCFSLQLADNFENSRVCVDISHKTLEWDLKIEKVPEERIVRVYLNETGAGAGSAEMLASAQETTEELDTGSRWIGRHARDLYKDPSKYIIVVETNKDEVYGKNIDEAVLSSRKKRFV